MTTADRRVTLAMYIPSMVGGGAQRVFALLATEFHRRGVPVELILSERRGPFMETLPHDLLIHDLHARRVSSSLLPLARYLRRRRPEVLLTTLTEANLVALAARGVSRTRVRLAIREVNHLSAIRRDNPTWRERMLLPLARRYYPSADIVVAPSRGVADDIAEMAHIDPDRLHVIPNPLPDFPDTSGVAHPWFEPGLPPVILAIGRLTLQKDYPTLLKAFADLRQRREARLIVLGEGEEREALERLVQGLGIAEDVDLHGFVPNPGPYLRDAALFVLSSAWEGLPNVMLQALAAGCPVVSTDCPSGPREILEDGRLGPLVPVHDHRALGRAMRSVLEHPTPKELLQQRVADYALEDIAARYLAVLFPEGH